MPSNLRFIRIPTLVVMVCLALSAAIIGGAAPGSAQAASCHTPKYPYAGYFTGGTFRVTKVSCAYGKTLILAFQKCRTQSGRNLDGRCTKKVNGFSCREKRNAIPTEIDATVTCRRGGTQRVTHSYQQNLGE